MSAATSLGRCGAILFVSLVMLTVGAGLTEAQSISPGTPIYTQYRQPPMEDNRIFYHLLFDQLEGRTNDVENEFRWHGEAWMGTDFNRLWFKSEGVVERGKATDGDTEALYDRPLPFLKYFDGQAGVRYDLDSNPGRTWGALGLEGLAPYWFQVEPTFYFSNDDRVAGKFFATYDLLLTNRLILQPEIEMNFYSKDEPARGTGSGLSDLDTGLRLRYEFIRDPAFSRKVAPYIGFAYTQTFGDAARFTREEGGIVHDPRFVYGISVWY
ncbi:MAG: copper resistance protein B [Candidatus Binataceae bacterium]